jgi:hypothetical protein
MATYTRIIVALSALLFTFNLWAQPTTRPAADGFVALFPADGEPKGWRVSDWSDVSKPPPAGAKWIVKDGVLYGSTPRGTWLISETLYGDFILDLDFRLGEAGNSGVGLRFPDAGDPAFDGMELQIVDERYYTKYNQQYGAESLTGSLYNAIPPRKQIYKPTEWNHYRVTCQGPIVRVELNGEVIQDVNLDRETRELEKGKPLRDRPRRGHLGFQELSRANGQVEIRGAKIKVLEGGTTRPVK